MRGYDIECVVTLFWLRIRQLALAEAFLSVSVTVSVMFSKLRLEFQFGTIARDRADQSRPSPYSGVDPYATCQCSRYQVMRLSRHTCPGPVHTTIPFNKLFQSRTCQADQKLPEKFHIVV